jgi:uncharacterized protein (DUF1697 family)
MSGKFLLIRQTTIVDEVLAQAARKRRMHKVQLIERLLTVIATDKLIDAVLDDVGSDEWNKNARRNWPT